MRTESLWSGQQRAARWHWWREVLSRPQMADWDEVFDEVVALRFCVGEAAGTFPVSAGDRPRTGPL